MNDLEKKIQHAINSESAENTSNTPDYILAQYLMACLAAFNTATQQRETWYGRDARPSALDSPAKEQPGELAEIVKRLNEAANSGEYALFAPYTPILLRQAAALIAKLGHGWIPVDRTAEYQEHHFKVEDVGVAWNGNRVWVCADSGALLRAKVMGEKLFVEFTPPAPGASDE